TRDTRFLKVNLSCAQFIFAYHMIVKSRKNALFYHRDVFQFFMLKTTEKERNTLNHLLLNVLFGGPMEYTNNKRNDKT
ncbi:hypothetical protein RFI_02436, partial [Reticulomyxa filosa]